MDKKTVKHVFTRLFAATLLLTTLLVSCKKEKIEEQGPQFHIEGHIIGAQDSTLCLEALTLDGLQLIDTVRLGSDGAFSFAYADTTQCPEFYRLRIDDQVINLSVDSTETIGIEARWPNMAFDYSVTGSGNCDTIRILTLALGQLENQIRKIDESSSMSNEEKQTRINELVKAYKDDVKINHIQNRYDRASSYFALFQMVGPFNVFDVQSNASDVQWLNAVANAWNERYPGSQRTQNLYNLALQGRKNTRPLDIKIDNEKVKETGIIDMGFPDITGKERRLSDLKGKVVLLDFTAYSAKDSKERVLLMRELYEKYHNRGFEIYQVSLDPQEHYWKTVCKNLPWICVYNAEGTSSDMITLYQVQQLGTYFLIDRDNNLVSRAEFIPDLEKAIEELL